MRVPDHGLPRQLRRRAAVEERLQRVRVDEVDVQRPQAAGEPGRVGGGGRAGEEQPHGAAAELVAPDEAGLLSKRQHLHLRTGVLEPLHQRTVLREQHERLDVVERADQLDEAELGPGELGRVAEEGDAQAPGGHLLPPAGGGAVDPAERQPEQQGDPVLPAVEPLEEDDRHHGERAQRERVPRARASPYVRTKAITARTR